MIRSGFKYIILPISSMAFLYFFFHEIFMSVFYTILLMTALAASITSAILLCLRRKEEDRKRRRKNLYQQILSASNVQEITNVLVEVLASTDISAAFFCRDDGFAISGNGRDIHVLDGSLPARSFREIKIYRVDPACDLDPSLSSLFKAGTVFVPVAKKRGEPCWQLHGCEDRSCAAHGKGECKCWLVSDKTFRGTELTSSKQKYSRCRNCSAFLPVGIIALRGKKMSAAIDLVSDHSILIANRFRLERQYARMQREVLFLRRHELLFTGHNIMNREGLLNMLKVGRPGGNGVFAICVCTVDLTNEPILGCEEITQLYIELADLLVHLTGCDGGIVARCGIADFTIMFPKEKKQVAPLAEMLRRSICNHDFDVGRKITLSIGIAGKADALDLETVVINAIEANKKARAVGNSVFCYEADFGKVVDESIKKDYLVF